MTRAQAIAILELDRAAAVAAILALARKAELYDQLQRAGGPASTDAAKPAPCTPSGMTPVYQKPNHRRRRKKPGRKAGHPGRGRRRPERIDARQTHTLQNCPHCQGPVSARPVRSHRRYVEDIPPVPAQVTEHTVHGHWCGRCGRIVTPVVTAALPGARLGLRLMVLTAWLHYAVGVSVQNLVRLLNVMCSLPVSVGGLTHAWGRLAQVLAPRYQAIRQTVAKSAVLHADETGWRVNGVTCWLWAFANRSWCYYLIARERASPIVRQVLGTFFAGTLICDFYGAYNRIASLAKQRCYFHLFTELVRVDQRNTSAAWRAFRKKLGRLLRDAVRLAEHGRARLAPAIYERRCQRIEARLDPLLAAPATDLDVRRLHKRLRRHRGELFTFLRQEGVSPYNNHAEQQMRPAVLVRKVSQQNRSARGAQTQAILMSLFRSCALQGQNPVETVLAQAQEELARPASSAHAQSQAA